MKKANSILWFSVFVFIACCSKVKNEENVRIDRTIMFDRFPDSLIATSVRSVEYILLEDVKESAFSEINKLVMKNGNIYIGDFRNHKIVVFDLAGNFKFAIDRKGRGPQEYLEIKNFAVDDHSIYVIDNYRHILYVYDSRSGKYLNKKKLPVVVWDVECFDNGDFLFAFAPLPGGSLSGKQSPHRLFVMDSNCRIKRRLFTYSEEDPIGKQTYFSTTEDRIVFHSCGSDVFTVFSKNNADTMFNIAVDFGPNKIPRDSRGDIHAINENGYHYLYGTPVMCRDYIALEVSIGDFLDCFLYDGKNGGITVNSAESSFKCLWFPLCSYNDKYVCFLAGDDSYKSLVADGFERAEPVVEEHLVNGGGVLVLYTMGTIHN